MEIVNSPALCCIDEYQDIVENFKGDMTIECIHCSAKRWREEKTSLCCHNGKTQNVPLQHVHPDIFDLFQGETSSSKHFLKNIRKYNQVFAMTSLQAANIDFHLASMCNGVYTLRINGSMYHQIGTDVVAVNDLESKFAQIYMLDNNMQIQRRLEIFENDPKADIVARIHHVLHENNVLVQAFKTAWEVLGADVANIQLHITGEVPTGEHSRRYNQPNTQGHVGAIVLDNDDLNAGVANIVLHQQNGELKK